MSTADRSCVETSRSPCVPAKASVDAVVVGAGFAGLYMLRKLHMLGLNAQGFEAGSGVGGTWYWNRYPGARCDTESMFYSYQFDDALQQEWEWSEKYAAQPEILAYAEHVAERFDLRRSVHFGTRVRAASFDEGTGRWTVETDTGKQVIAQHLIMAVGCLSSAARPAFLRGDAAKSFRGAVYHTGEWPHDGVDFSGLRVGVLGTGSSGIQVIPIIAQQCKHLTVFQRTANFAVPAHNAPLDPQYVREVKSKYSEHRTRARGTPGGHGFKVGTKAAMEVSAEEREAEYERRWALGGLGFLASFTDLLTNETANATAADFVRRKIRAIVADKTTAERLCPDIMIGCKRLCVHSGYYESFNQPHVKLVDVRETPIQQLGPEGLVVGGEIHALDALVCATGFDAMTGALLKIDIRGRGGMPLREAWSAGPRSLLGIGIAGFPNLFTITGPGSPSVLTNMIPTVEQHVDWIASCLDAMRREGWQRIEADMAAQDAWIEHVNEVAGGTVRAHCSSWYLGANIPGKPRVFMPFSGGMPAYRAKCDSVASAGYEGFLLS